MVVIPKLKNVYNCVSSLFQPIRNMRDIYHGNINDLDIWPAGLLETTINGPGELFRTIILDQFRRIRDGDRFWFENYELNG